MKQMTDKEIIKTAECCLQAKTREDCHDLRCPCDSIYSCMFFDRSDDESDFAVPYEIIKELLGVINRQHEQLEAAIAGQETLQKALAEKDREVERLTTKKEQLIKTFGECQTEATRALAEKDKEIEQLTAENDRLINTFGERQLEAIMALADEYKKIEWLNNNSTKATVAEAIREFSKAVIDGIDEGYILHSSDIVDFTHNYLNVKSELKDEALEREQNG